MSKQYTSPYNPAATELSNALRNDRDIRPDMFDKITRVLEGVEVTDKLLLQKDQVISQKEQLLAQQARELARLKEITDNSSKVARDVVQESKANLDKAIKFFNSGEFSEALKYSDIALYNIEDINSLGVQTVAQANTLYLENKQRHVDSALIRDKLYNSAVVNGVNAFGWVKENPTLCFYSFFKNVLKVPDNTPDNVKIIKKLYELLPLYIAEAQRANGFYNEYNKYYDALTKLQQVVNILNIKATSSKGLKNYEEALKSCDIALNIDPTSSTLLSLKTAVLGEKQVKEASKLEEHNFVVSQAQEIEWLKAALAQKNGEIADLKLKNYQLSHIDKGTSARGFDVGLQTDEIPLAGDVNDVSMNNMIWK